MTIVSRAAAQTSPAPEPAKPAQPAAQQPSTFDNIWKFADWYRSETNPVVQRVLFSGRFQYEFNTIHADQGDHDEWNVRRLRLGPRITFLRRFLFHTEVELNPQEHDPLYLRMTDLYLQWNRSAGLALTLGKQAVQFTADGATSSKELLTIDRSNLANNIWFTQEYMPGVSASGRRGQWNYRGGVYSAGARNRELGEFNGGWFTLGTLGYDFANALGVKEAVLTGNYVYQQEDEENSFTRELGQIGSVHFRLEDERWGLRTDLSLASGQFEQSDLWGVMLMPFFNLTRKLQFVTRYTFLDSADPNGLRLATYENAVVEDRGDRYQEGYVGANYYFYGHKLKLQSGLQYADMNDRANDGGAYSGWSWTTGIRVGW